MPDLRKKTTTFFAQHQLLKQLNIQYSFQSAREALSIFPMKKQFAL